MVYSKEWGQVDEDGNFLPTRFRPLKTEPCSESEFNLDGDQDQEKYNFYTPAKQFARDT